MKWTVREVVGQEYVFEVEAETLDEAINKIKIGHEGKCVETHEARPHYTGHPKGYTHSISVDS